MFYAQKLETQHARGETFNKNFFEDFQKVLKKHPAKDGTKIEKFAKCDFRPMYSYWKGMKDAEADRRKGLAPSARKDELEKKKKMEAEMKTCIVDGEEQKVGNVMAEPPSLFLGRGAHPKTGHIKVSHRPVLTELPSQRQAAWPLSSSLPSAPFVSRLVFAPRISPSTIPWETKIILLRNLQQVTSGRP